MRKVPWWLHDMILRGYEGEGEETGETGETEETEETGETEETEGGKKGETDDYAELKGALNKERRQNKQNAKLLKQLQAEKEAREQAELSDTEKSKAAAAKANDRVAALAVKFKTNAVNTAIIAQAAKMKFRDTDDALAGVDRSLIDVEQDEDEPENVTVDAKTVEAAVKALADKKKYLIQSEGETDPSGSRFGGGGGQKKSTTDEDLIKKYPALNM